MAEPLDRVTWAGRHTPSLVDWTGSWRTAGRRQVIETLGLAGFLYWVAPDQLMSDGVQLIGAVIVGVVLMPLLEGCLNIFRAPSLELQRSNAELSSKVMALTAQLEQATGELTARADSLVDANVVLTNENDTVYLAITNKGPAAEFYAMLKASGVDDWPQKEVFARWDAVFVPRQEIARGVTAKLRLAKTEAKNGAFRWRVFLVAMSYMDKLSRGATFPGSQPPTDNWSVILDIQIIAKPELRHGPVECKVELLGDGNFRLLTSRTVAPRSSQGA